MIYISGPITENPDYEEHFGKAEKELTGAGYNVYNPAGDPLEFSASHAAYMRRDLKIILEESDGIALLPGWAESPGAYVEKQVADIIGLPVKTVQAWVAAGTTKPVIPTRTPTAREVAEQNKAATDREKHLAKMRKLRHSLITIVQEPPQPPAHYAVNGENVIPLVPPYLKPRGPHEPPESVAVEKMDHQIAEQETRDDMILPPAPQCKHLWLIAETSDGLVKECPNCGETQIERQPR